MSAKTCRVILGGLCVVACILGLVTVLAIQPATAQSITPDLSRSDVIKIIAVVPENVGINLRGVGLSGLNLAGLDLSHSNQLDFL